MLEFIKQFLKLESAGGIILMGVAALAMLCANSALSASYVAFQASPAHFWVNDGLMAIFFLMVGAEIKREMVEGELNSLKKSLLPIVAALGGVALPALIYSYCNAHTENVRGWAIPSATDIAFSLGILSLFGNRVSPSLTIFLMAVAVIDDLAAVAIIALFYTDDIKFLPLLGSLTCFAGLAVLNWRKKHSLPLFLGLGTLMWAFMLPSGVHPTIAGVLLGLSLPLELGRHVIHALHPWVAYAIVPLFAFMNAGVPLGGIGMEQLQHPVTAGIALGLFFGKQLGIFAASWLLVLCKLAEWPAGATKIEFYAVCMIAGIGFTMSLFIGTLAFADEARQLETRLGVIAGSLLSAIAGALLMAGATRGKAGTA